MGGSQGDGRGNRASSISDHGPVGQRELAELMGVDHIVLVNLLNPLEAARLRERERERDTVDRRLHVVKLAAAGERRLAQADRAFRDAETAFLAPLSADERQDLHSMLSRLRKAARASTDSDC